MENPQLLKHLVLEREKRRKDLCDGFWTTLKKEVESNKRFPKAWQKETAYVLVLDQITQLAQRFSPLPEIERLVSKKAKRKRLKITGRISDLQEDLKSLGVTWSVWEVFEMEPSLPKRLPTSPKAHIVQPKLHKLPRIVEFLELLKKKVDQSVRRASLLQPQDELAEAHGFCLALNGAFEQLLGKPLHRAVAAAARIYFDDDWPTEPDLRKWLSRQSPPH
jgi:hypothetical protein